MINVIAALLVGLFLGPVFVLPIGKLEPMSVERDFNE